MGIREFFQNISWRATLQTVLIRVLVASILWPIVIFVTGGIGSPGEFFAMTVTFFVILLVFLVVAIPVVGLSRAGVPYVGLLALPAWLVVIGDPVVWILHGTKPEWVPVDDFRLVNPPVLAVFKTAPQISEEAGVS